MLMFSFNHRILLWFGNTCLMVNNSFFYKKKSSKASSIALSVLKNLMELFNWVLTYAQNHGITLFMLDLCFKRYIHVYLLLSSTLVAKNLWPVWVECWYGPHISQCTRENVSSHMWLKHSKGNCFCLARGHT